MSKITDSLEYFLEEDIYNTIKLEEMEEENFRRELEGYDGGDDEYGVRYDEGDDEGDDEEIDYLNGVDEFEGFEGYDSGSDNVATDDE